MDLSSNHTDNMIINLEKSSSTFSEDQYNDDDDMLGLNSHRSVSQSATPKVTALKSLTLAMKHTIDLGHSSGNSYPECDVVRAAIHHLGDLFCEFNDALSTVSKASKNSDQNSSNLSYKEHQNESIDVARFVTFLEDKFSLFGYNTKEITQLFILLKPQTPNTIKLNTNKPLTVHFTEFNVVIHQFYTKKKKSIFIDKTSYQKQDIHALLLHSIKSKLQSIKSKLNTFNAMTDLELLHSPSNDMTQFSKGQKHGLTNSQMQISDLTQTVTNSQQSLLLGTPDIGMYKMTHSHTSSFNASSKGSPVFNDMLSPNERGIGGLSNEMILNITDTPVSNIPDVSFQDNMFDQFASDNEQNRPSASENENERDTHEQNSTDTYEETDSESESDDYDIDDIMREIEDEIHDQMSLGTLIGFGDSGLYIECVDGKPEYDTYEFYAPHTLFQDQMDIATDANNRNFNHLCRMNSARSDASGVFSSTNPSPLSRLSSKPKSGTHIHSVENPFQFATIDTKDPVLKRQEYLYQYSQFFGQGNVYLTTQQLRFVDLNPSVPRFMQENKVPHLNSFEMASDDAITPFTPNNVSIPKARNRSGNIRDIAQRNTETDVICCNDDNEAKVNENTDLYDEDKKLASLLQNLVRGIHYHFVPNGLLTHSQFLEFIDLLQIYNYDEYVLKHMFRYIYTDELPPTLPPPPVIEFRENEEDNYNNVNGMYVAYSECIGYEYDEILDLVKDLKVNTNGGNSFDDLLTTMVVERLQTIYQTLKFDDLDAHPNQFLHRENSMSVAVNNNKLNGDELKENVFNFFEENNANQNNNDTITVNVHAKDEEYTQHTALSTMRSTESQTLTYNGLFRQSILSADSLNNLLQNLKKEKKDKKEPKTEMNVSIGSPLTNNTPKLFQAMSNSTATITHYNPQTPLTPNTQASFDKYPALIDINDIPASYHHRIQSLQSKLMRKGSSLNALVDYDDKSMTSNTHKSPSNNVSTVANLNMSNNVSHVSHVSHVSNVNPSMDANDIEDEKESNTAENMEKGQPAFITQLSNDSNSDIQSISPNAHDTSKRKKPTSKRGHSASRQPSLPTLPEEHIGSIHNNQSKTPLLQPIGADLDIDGKVDQLFATIGSDQVHIDLLKYGLKLIEISFTKYEQELEHYFLHFLQTYAKHKYNNKFFVHKSWIKQFLYDENIPHNLHELQSKIITNLQRKSHLLLVSELSPERSNSYVTNSSYQRSEEMHSYNQAINIGMSRELQQTYVLYFKQTLKSRSKALTQYTHTRYSPTHSKYWRDVFFFMSDGEKYLDRHTFRAGIGRCGIKVRTASARHKKANKNREIDKILNAVFVEMDYQNSGYITVHAFASMMLSHDPILNRHSSHNHSHRYANTNNLTVPSKNASQNNNYNYYGQNTVMSHQYYGYHNAPPQNVQMYRNDLMNNNNNNTAAAMYGYNDQRQWPKAKQERRSKREPQQTWNQKQYLRPEIVEEKTQQMPTDNNNNEQNYLNNAWNGYNDEETDEKIPMLEVLNNHEINMQNKNKKQKNQNKKNKNSFSFIVTRKRLNALDLIQRRYYLTIDRQNGSVLLSPANSHCQSEIAMEFGLHQIIDGDHQSTEIQIKTVHNKKIYYEFGVRQSKDEFVDLLEEVKHDRNFGAKNDNILPRGTGFENNGNDYHGFEEDIDPIYDDECSICISKLFTQATISWFSMISLVNIVAVYVIINSLVLFPNYSVNEKLCVWILVSMIALRLSDIQCIRTRILLLFSKIFDCICCHRFAYYGFSTHSLITIWTIFWLVWSTFLIGGNIWNGSNDSNVTMDVLLFAFVVLSLTFLVFAQFAYCRCRGCSVTLSELLHTILQRLSVFFMSVYGILYRLSVSAHSADIIYYISFWFCVALITEFGIYTIYVFLLHQNQSRIDSKDVNVRVLSPDLCELQMRIPFPIRPLSYVWISDDRDRWMQLPLLLITNNQNSEFVNQGRTNNHILKGQKNSKKKQRNVETNPYHHTETSSNDNGSIELQTMNILQKKHKLKKNKYVIIDSHNRNDSQDSQMTHTNQKNTLLSLIIHSRNRMGERMIHKLAHTFEQSNFDLFIKKHTFPLTILCFAFVYKQIGIIATDDRVIPAISYMFSNQNKKTKNPKMELLWIVNKPKKQYLNLYQLLQSLKKRNKNISVNITDMTKKKSSKEKQMSHFLSQTSAQAIFALTSRYTGQNIKKLSKKAVVYIQQNEWY